MVDISADTTSSGQPYSTWVSVMLGIMFTSIVLIFLVFPAGI
jgi:hypothetical protein